MIRTVLNSIHADDWQNQSTLYGVIKDKGLSKGSQPHDRGRLQPRQMITNCRRVQVSIPEADSELKMWKSSAWTQTRSANWENMMQSCMVDDILACKVTIKLKQEHRDDFFVWSSTCDYFIPPFLLTTANTLLLLKYFRKLHTLTM